jgi:uncharacterized membrane protein YphA (DoxX/SURF4 family)
MSSAATGTAVSTYRPATSRAANATYQAYQILHFGFIVLPIIAGIDKYLHWLVDWDKYLAPFVTQTLHIPAQPFMWVVGIVEIIAGLLVAFWPRVGAYIVMLWLWGIVINLLIIPGYFDIALRDFGLSLGALALARLSADFATGPQRTIRSSV